MIEVRPFYDPSLNKKLIALLLALTLLLVGAIGAVAASQARTYTYTGKTNVGKPVKLKIGFTAYNNSTWVMYQSYGSDTCAGSGSWAVNGGLQVNKKTKSFTYRHVDNHAGGYVDMKITHGKVSGWNGAIKAWKRAAGTYRVVYNEPAYVDSYGESHPRIHCDTTFNWTATRRG